MGIAIDIAIEHEAWRRVGDLDGLARRAVDAALACGDADLEEEVEVSLLLCDDVFIQNLNKTWRGKDRPTNVLSFPTEEPALLGDIVVAYETTAREAVEEGKSLSDHLSHLIVHGVLHLVGYDHEDEAEAEAMEQLESEVLATLGIACPYRIAEVRMDEEDRRAQP